MQGYDHKRIYVEGFSDTVNQFTVRDLQQVKEHNNVWAPSFYNAVGEFDALKPEDRVDFKAVLHDLNPPSWAREGDSEISRQLLQHSQQQSRATAWPPNNRPVDSDDDVEPPPASSTSPDKLYVQKNRMPPVKVCLLYNPLMYISPSSTRTEWEQQLGGFPAFFIYTMSRSIYSSANNPLLKPEYFMPEAKPMTTHARWHEHMDDGDNPFAGYCVAGWACQQFTRVMDACKLSVTVSEVAKVQMVMDYMQTCFNMHLGLIDSKSMRSKTVYWAHRLMREVEDTVHHDLINFLQTEMGLGTDTGLAAGHRTMSGKPLADGGYAQVSYLHCESMNILNRDFFHLNDLNLSVLWRMLATTTHHCVGMNNGDLSAMGSSIVACRGGGHYAGRFVHGNVNTNNGVANTYQALDKPNSVGGDYVVSHHAWMKGLNSNLSATVRAFDNGQVPSDMTRFTEASMRMIGTVLVDDRNNVRKEPMDNLLTQYYQTEMQITNVDQVCVCTCVLLNQQLYLRGLRKSHFLQTRLLPAATDVATAFCKALSSLSSLRLLLFSSLLLLVLFGLLLLDNLCTHTHTAQVTRHAPAAQHEAGFARARGGHVVCGRGKDRRAQRDQAARRAGLLPAHRGRHDQHARAAARGQGAPRDGRHRDAAHLLWRASRPQRWSLQLPPRPPQAGLRPVHVERGEGARNLPEGVAQRRVALLHSVLCERLLRHARQQARHVLDGAKHAVQGSVQVGRPAFWGIFLPLLLLVK